MRHILALILIFLAGTICYLAGIHKIPVFEAFIINFLIGIPLGQYFYGVFSE